jgi:hypothetical protein
LTLTLVWISRCPRRVSAHDWRGFDADGPRAARHDFVGQSTTRRAAVEFTAQRRHRRRRCPEEPATVRPPCRHGRWLRSPDPDRSQTLSRPVDPSSSARSRDPNMRLVVNSYGKCGLNVSRQPVGSGIQTGSSRLKERSRRLGCPTIDQQQDQVMADFLSICGRPFIVQNSRQNDLVPRQAAVIELFS